LEWGEQNKGANEKKAKPNFLSIVHISPTIFFAEIVMQNNLTGFIAIQKQV
jgi:hypothetical protein